MFKIGFQAGVQLTPLNTMVNILQLCTCEIRIKFFWPICKFGANCVRLANTYLHMQTHGDISKGG